MAYRGLLLCDERWIYDNLSASDSAYLEVGPHPGVPVDQGTVRSRMTLQASGDMAATDDVTVTALSTGFPGSGATYKYKQTSGGSTFGWDAPCGLSGYETLNLVSDGATAFRTNHACALRLQSGDVLVACRIAGTTATGDNSEYNTGIYKLTGSTGAVAYVSRAFSSSYDQNGVEMKSPGLVQLPSGRVLCFDWDLTSSTATSAQISISYSDDDGATWSLYADKVLDDPISSSVYDVTKYSRIRVAYSNGQLLLLAQLYTGGAYYLLQWGSDDLGTTFRTVNSSLDTSGAGSCANILPRIGGGFTCIYLDGSVTTAKAVGSCWDDVVDAGTSITITPPDVTTDLCAWDGEDGTLWAAGVGAAAAIWCMVSRDGGDTWYDIGSLDSAAGNTPSGSNDTNAGLWVGGAAGVGFQRFSMAEFRGRTAMVAESSVNTAYDAYSLLLCYLGGHTDVCMPRSPRAAYGHANDSIGWATTYAGFFNPTSSAVWTAFSTGAPTTDITTAGWDIQCAATENLFYELDATLIDDADVSNRDYLFLVEATANTGGSTSTDDIAFALQLADGTDDVDCVLRLSSTGFALYDSNAGANAFAPVNNTGSTQYLLYISGSHNATMAVELYYRAVGAAPGHPLRDWTLAGSGTLTNDTATPGAAAVLKWGSYSAVAGTTRSHWRLVCQLGIKQSYGFSIGATGGRWLGSVPATLAQGTRIRGVDGPAIQGDSWEILPRFDHGIRNMFADIAPSPRQTFQTEQKNPTNIAIALGTEGTMLGTTSIGLSLWNTNLRSFTLQRYDGTWHNVAAVTNGWSSLAFTRVGGLVTVNTTADGVPWLPYERLVGGYVELADGLGGVSYCRIIHNTSGRWSAETGLRATLTLHPDDVDGTVPTSGNAWIVPPNITVLMHDISATSYYRWRITVSDLDVPDADNGRWRIGTAIFGPVAYFGRQYGAGRVVEVQPNVDVQTRRSGTRASRVLGPTRRRYSFAWQDNPIDETELGNATTASPDVIYATTYTGTPVAAPADTGLLVEGLVERLQGPHALCVYLPAIEKATGNSGAVVSTTICHPSLHDLVRVVSGTRREAFLGNEGSNELARYADLVLEQEV